MILIAARGVPLRYGIRDDRGRFRSQLSETDIARRLLLKPLAFRLQIGFRLLKLGDQPLHLCNRRGYQFLDLRRDVSI